MALANFCYIYLEGQSVHLFSLSAPCQTSKVYNGYNSMFKQDYDEAEITGIYIRNSSNEKGDNVSQKAQLDQGEYILVLQKMSSENLSLNKAKLSLDLPGMEKISSNSNKSQKSPFHLSDSLKTKKCLKKGCTNEAEVEYDHCSSCLEKLKESEFYDYYYGKGNEEAKKEDQNEYS